jgi:hypothetical protein
MLIFKSFFILSFYIQIKIDLNLILLFSVILNKKFFFF